MRFREGLIHHRDIFAGDGKGQPVPVNRLRGWISIVYMNAPGHRRIGTKTTALAKARVAAWVVCRAFNFKAADMAYTVQYWYWTIPLFFDTCHG